VKIFVSTKTLFLEIEVGITGYKGNKLSGNFCRFPSAYWTKLLKSLLTLSSVHGDGNAYDITANIG